MYCFSLLVFGVLAGAGVVAAPALLPVPWVAGWDRPVDRLGGCHFDRKGYKLTITVPGKDNISDPDHPHPNACLMRDVEGDFVVQVRVGGDFRPKRLGGANRDGIVQRSAGLILRTDRDWVFGVERVAVNAGNDPTCCPGILAYVGRNLWFEHLGVELASAVYLRLERRGDALLVSWGTDGRWWKEPRELASGFGLPRRVKVGVTAASTAGVAFAAEFDQFRLSPLPGPVR